MRHHTYKEESCNQSSSYVDISDSQDMIMRRSPRSQDVVSSSTRIRRPRWRTTKRRQQSDNDINNNISTVAGMMNTTTTAAWNIPRTLGRLILVSIASWQFHDQFVFYTTTAKTSVVHAFVVPTTSKNTIMTTTTTTATASIACRNYQHHHHNPDNQLGQSLLPTPYSAVRIQRSTCCWATKKS